MDIKEILNNFQIDSEIKAYSPLGNGHINSTFLVETISHKKYVLQKINNNVFKDVDLLMSNYSKVTNYLFENGFESIHLVKTSNGCYYYQYNNEYYRLYDFIDDAIWYEGIDNTSLIYSAAKAFGILHKSLKGFDTRELGEVIPNFHNTYLRYLNLLDAIKVNKMDRVKDCQKEIECVKKYAHEYGKIVDGIKDKTISLSVSHNDPKINNVLFDAKSGAIRAVIDLDTIMPGSYLYDFGDALRSLFTGDNEDSKDLSKLVVNYDVFDAYTKGYMEEMKDILTLQEVELLPFSVFLLTIECGMRFLEDHIRGDVYFRIHYPNQNLIRARTQLTLANNVYQSINALKSIVEKYK